jgi:hypothetical protein
MRSAPIFIYPNQMGMILQLAMEEILGKDGVDAVVKIAGVKKNTDNHPHSNSDVELPYFHVMTMQDALEKLYGQQAGRGLALQIGRACFTYCLRELGPEFGLTDLPFRLLPLSSRLMKGSESLVALFYAFTDQAVHLEQNDGFIYWNIEMPPSSSENLKVGPVSMLAVGLLQEAFYWLSAGRNFRVEEKRDIAYGDSVHTIIIDRNPMS